MLLLLLLLLQSGSDGGNDADAPPSDDDDDDDDDDDEAADAKASARPIDASNTVKRSTKISIMCTAYFFKNKLTSRRPIGRPMTIGRRVRIC